MESQPGRRAQLPVHAHSHRENGQTFLRFTEQLNQQHDAEQFLLALPALLHNLVPADIFMVLDLEGSSSASRAFVHSRSGGTLPSPDLLSGKPSACFWVQENQRPLVIPSIATESRFPDTMEWFRSSGDRSLCVLPLRTSVRRLGVLCAGRSSEDAFSEEEIALLTLAADYAALAMDDRLNFAASEKAPL